MRSKIRIAICALVLSIGANQPLQAQSCPGGSAYFARPPLGDDGNDGSASYPVRTINRAKEVLSRGGGRIYYYQDGKVYFVQCVKESHPDDIPTG